MINLKKTDWEQIATIYNIFGKRHLFVDWKSIKGSPFTVAETMEALKMAADQSNCKPYVDRINWILDEFNRAINASIKVKF